jgi:hypothetical protein
VDEPRELAEGREFEDLQSASLTESPRSGDARNRRLRGRRLAGATARQRSFSGSHNQTSIIATG